MSHAQTIATEWTAEKCLDKRVQSKQTRKHKLGNREQTDGGKCRQTLAAQAAKTEQFKQQRQQCQRQPQLNNDLIFNLRISRELRIIQFVYTVRNIPNRTCKTASKFEKQILKTGRFIVQVLRNMQTIVYVDVL